MKDRKRRLGTRDAVETAIDMSKLSKSASWDDLIKGKYQAVRRCWRFGQRRPVEVHMLIAETERAIIRNFREKERAAEVLSASMVEHMRHSFMTELGALQRETNPYDADREMEVPGWLR